MPAGSKGGNIPLAALTLGQMRLQRACWGEGCRGWCLCPAKYLTRPAGAYKKSEFATAGG